LEIAKNDALGSKSLFKKSSKAAQENSKKSISKLETTLDALDRKQKTNYMTGKGYKLYSIKGS